MKITVLGCGRWGSFLAYYAAGLGHEVVLWGRPGSESLKELAATRRNAYLTLPAAVWLSDDLAGALAGAGLVLVAVGAQQLRGFLAGNAGLFHGGAPLVLCMKGLEAGTGRRLTGVAAEELGAAAPCAVLVGPGHVEDFVAGQPGCMLVCGSRAETVRDVLRALSGALLRLYCGEDLLGAEVGAAAKNVIGIAAGMLDGMGVPSLKGALMTRGAYEIARLVRRMGGHEQTVYGLSHLGDYEATLFSPHSHNRAYGEALVRGRPYRLLAEGVGTASAMELLARLYGVDLPICAAVHSVLKGGAAPEAALGALFDRPGRYEFT